MKIENNVEWWNIGGDDKDGKMLVKSLMDDSEWEYERFGFCKDRKGLFIVDLDDSGEEWRSVNRVKKGLSIEDVCKIGVECGVLVKNENGYDEEDDYRYCMDCGDENMSKFGERVLENGKFVLMFYSCMEE
jgi:hypothetical protein